MKLFGKSPAAATERIGELTAGLAAIEQKLAETRDYQKRSFAEGAVDDAAIAAVSIEALEDQRQGLQKALAEVQRRRQEADQGLTVLQEAEAAARLKVSDLLENIARDIANTAADYDTESKRLAAILSEVDVPVASLTDHCGRIVAEAGEIARELQRVAGEMRDGSRPLPKVSLPPDHQP